MLITTKTPERWQDLQTKVGEILERCGFITEIEKNTKTVRGNVEIDVYAEEVIKGRKYSIICECKFWKSNIPQQIIHGFRTVVADLGSNIGYIITTSNFQSGAIKASELTNIELLSWEDFQDKFFESWFHEYFSSRIAKELDPLLTYTEPLLPKWFYDMSEEDQDGYYELKEKYDHFGWFIMSLTPYSKIKTKEDIPTLPIKDRIRLEEKSEFPDVILKETGYEELLEQCIEFGNNAINEFREYQDKYVTSD